MQLSSLPDHHAILITDILRKELSSTLWQELQETSNAHRLFDATVLDIDTSRTISSWAKTPYDKERFALISFHTATIPAQNALLKVLEEPENGVRFIIVTSNKENLLDTVLSRLQHVDVGGNTSMPAVDALEFLRASHNERMNLPCVVKLLSQVDEEDRKDREAVRNFILSLSKSLPLTASTSRYIEEIITVSSYASDPSSSGKALLEYLSLILPQTKA